MSENDLIASVRGFHSTEYIVCGKFGCKGHTLVKDLKGKAKNLAKKKEIWDKILATDNSEKHD